jgi:hypothetical protein
MGLTGCVSTPKGFLRPSKNYLENRQLQMRQYDTKDERKIISAVAGVLQDLGFTLDFSETEIGLITSSTRANATHAGQITIAIVADILSAIGGTQSNNIAECDKEQEVKASVIVRPSLDDSKIVVRVTFQRIVWNMQNQVCRIETINDPEIYEKFYSALSKSIFLEEQQI